MGTAKDAIDLAEKVGNKLRPPKGGEDPVVWRWMVLACIAALWVLVVVHVTLAKGVTLGAIEISPVVRENVMKVAINERVSPLETQFDLIDRRTKSILRAQFTPQIRALIRARCDATAAADREQVNRALDSVMGDFKDSSGEDYAPLPRCDEV